MLVWLDREAVSARMRGKKDHGLHIGYEIRSHMFYLDCGFTCRLKWHAAVFPKVWQLGCEGVSLGLARGRNVLKTSHRSRSSAMMLQHSDIISSHVTWRESKIQQNCFHSNLRNMFSFPTLTCRVFVFSSVSAFLRLPSSSLSHSSLTHSLTHPLTHSFTHSLTHPLTHSLTLTRSLAHSFTHSLTHSNHILAFAWQARDNVHCQGVGCTPWHPLGSASFAWQAWDNVHCQGVGCTPWRPLGSFCVAGVGLCALPRGWMYALASLGLRLFCAAGVGQCALPRGWMYALASLGLRFFCVAGVDNVQCQGVGCTPRGVPCHGLRLFCVAGVGQCALPRSLGLRFFCVAGVGQCALPRGWMYALASLGLRFFCVAGVGLCALPRGWMYALAPLGLHLFCVAGVGHSLTSPTH